jgi:hypothetical protein
MAKGPRETTDRQKRLDPGYERTKGADRDGQ